MTDITFIPATEDHARLIAPRLLVTECTRKLWKQHGRDAEENTLYTLRRSIEAGAAFVDGEIAALYGIGARSLVSEEGYPWLLPTDLIRKHKVAFFRRTRAYIETAMASYPTLKGEVDTSIPGGVTWLKWLGFSVEETDSNIRTFSRGASWI